MTRDPVLLLGAGGHARACIDVIEEHGGYEIGGLIGRTEEVGLEVLGYPVVGADKDLIDLTREYRHVIVAAGQIKTPDLRIRLRDAAREAGYQFPTVVSPRAHVSQHAEIGEGTVVLHGAVVNAGARVGRNCIVNSMALVEHDVTVADHCHVSTGARVNSGVAIGSGTFIGSGAIVRQSLTIGSRCVVGMGQRVLRDCPDGCQVPRR